MFLGDEVDGEEILGQLTIRPEIDHVRYADKRRIALRVPLKAGCSTDGCRH